MKRWELLTIQIFAVFCTYLIIAITFTTALEIRIYTSGDQEFTSDLFEFSDFIDKDFSYPYTQNYQYIRIRLSSRTLTYFIDKVYLFACKGLDPLQCIENGIQPTVSMNTGSSSLVFDQTYRWNDVSSNDAGNFLTLAKLDVGGKVVWTGSWDKFTKTGVSSFESKSYDMDRLDLYLKPGISGETVKSYVETYHSIPSDHLNRSVFQTVSGTSVEKLYDLSGNNDDIDPSGTGTPAFYTGTFSDNVFDESLRTWDFVFGSDGKTSNPAVFYSSEAGPPTTTGASMVIDSLSPQVVTCGSDEVIQTSMHVENASDIGYFQSYYYEMDGVRGSEGSITCSIINSEESIYSYECSVPVANFPVCNAPGTSTITFYFSYEGGVKLSAGFPVTLKTPNPQLIVNSVSPNPFDCEIDTELTSQLRVINPMELTPETHYTFDGTNFHPLTCSGSGSSYTCEIPENEICPLLQEDLELTFKFVYDELEVLSLPTQMFVTFPPPSLGIDTVTPQTVEAGETTSVEVLLHVNYPDFITYDADDFNYRYLNKAFQPAACVLKSSYTNIKYYECAVDLEIPATEEGVKTISFRLDGFMEGEPEQKTANAFFEILPPPPEPDIRVISTSSPLDCVQDSSLTVNARVENIEGSPETHYSIDSGQTYEQLTCSASGDTYTCSIPRDDLCDFMSNVLTLMLKFVYPDKELISNPQKVYLDIPEPHMQVYLVQPNTLPIGEKTSVTVNLFVQYPQMVGDNPVFLYSYSGKTDQMSCTKVSSKTNRDYYECAGTEFDVPADYSGSSLPAVFSIQGTTLSFPVNIPVESIERTLPWLEIVSTTPSRIETTPGNRTSASFYVTVHNAADNELKHQATLMPNSWISSGTCDEAQIEYDFICDVTINVPRTASTGFNPVTLSLKVSDSKTFDISDTTNVYVLPEETQVEIQSVSPDRLYCEGHTQQNPQGVRITARVKNLAEFVLVEEDMIFNGLTISHTARYCTSQGQGITCEIPSSKFLEKVNCGQGELAPGEGSHYYPLTLTFLVESGGELTTVSGSRDVSIEARPLEPYLEIADNDVVDNMLQTRINCLGSQTIKIGDTGYIRIKYADLLHTDATEDDLTWSFRLDAHDDQGKLTRGMGVSPEADATICNLIDYQRVGSHRIEDYECSLYVSTAMFQRCANGEGEIMITATSGGKKAEGKIGAMIIRDDSDYQIDMEIVSEPAEKVECQVQGYGEGVRCSLASYSNQNVTIRMYNLNQEVELTDLNLYSFDIDLTGDMVNANERTLGNCNRDSSDSLKYLCPFQIGPVINLPETTEYEVIEDPEQTFPTIPLGKVNITVYVKYANNLARATVSKLDGDIKIQPKKSDSMISSEKMREKMQENFEKFEDIFKWVVFGLSFCTVCGLGNEIVNSITESMPKKTPDETDGEDEPETSHDDCVTWCVELGGGIEECEEECKGKISAEYECYGDQDCITKYNDDTCICEDLECDCLGGTTEEETSPAETPSTTTQPPAVVCPSHKYCSECVLDTTNACVWCVDENKCKSLGYQCTGSFTNNLDVCTSGKTSCTQIFNCPDCVKSPNLNCVWCVDENKCKSLGYQCTGSFTNNLDACPVSTSPNSPSDYQPETGRISFDGEESDGNLGQALAMIGSAVSLFLFAALILKIFKTGDENEDVEEEKSEIVKYMEKGIKWGIAACVMPRVVGEMGAWIAGEGSAAEGGFEKVAAFGKGLGNVCNVLMRILPLVMMLIQFYISYLRFEMCMDMLEIQIEAGAQAAAQAQEPYQAQAGVQAGVTMMANMMTCFNQLMQAMNQLTMTSMFMSQQLGSFGGGTYAVIFKHRSSEIKPNSNINGAGIFEVEVQNICKGGNSQARIDITGTSKPGQQCRSSSSSQSCVQQTFMPYIPQSTTGIYPRYPYQQQQTGSLRAQINTADCSSGKIHVTITKGTGTTDPYEFDYTETGTGEGYKNEGETCTQDSECRSGLKCCNTKTSVYKVCSESSNCLKSSGELCINNDQCTSGLYCCFFDPSRSDKKCYGEGSSCICYDSTRGNGICKSTCGSDVVVVNPAKPCPFPLQCCIELGDIGDTCEQESECKGSLYCCHTSDGDVNTGTKHCTNNLMGCKCYHSGKYGFCESYEIGEGFNCQTSSQCPNNGYCCVEQS